ncbi:MAG: TetR/AcrR family transcriptional regulator [Candidatus Marinimicrobia bacterium]|nr:TetR/AcrR family transcriptional regulator [Candidatus Neomarinimicrobiota bacterium]MCF7840882.1 TetR/AcrR family transcriptional regulator [Candidatus Neomarinimicrobiota bacterium]
MESILPSRKNKQPRSKHDQLLETARELVSRHGVRRVTVEEICRKASVSKVTFYKYYPNKQAIVWRILDDMVEYGIARFNEIIGMDISFEEKLRLIIQVKMEESAKYSEDFLEELIHADPDLMHHFWEKAIAAQSMTMDFFRQAQKDGELRTDMNPDFLQFMMDHVQDLIQDPRLQKILPSKLDLIRELINFWFYGLLPPGGPR